MKMNKLIVTLLSLGLLAQQAQQAPAQSGPHFSSGSATRSLKDHSSLNRFASSVSPVYSEDSILAPTATNEGSAIIDDGSYGSYGDASCCYDGCSMPSCGSQCGGFGGCVCLPRTWFSAETLLVFAADRNSPVLATTSGTGVFPIQGANGVTNRFGGPLSSDMLPGFRLSAGRYFGPHSKVGIGARGYGIYNRTESLALSDPSGTGESTIGVPFFNLSAVAIPAANQTIPGLSGTVEDAYVVSGQTPGGDQISTGSLAASESLRMVGGEISGYLLMTRSGCMRTDLVAGYTYNVLRNKVSLSTESTNLLVGDLITNGTVLTTFDQFATDNRFSGAHIGVQTQASRKRVSLSTLAKVSFGNMRSRVSVNGQNTIGAAQDDGGIFAQASNIGTRTHDKFAFLPELGGKLGYCIRPNIQLTGGYTLWFWSDVMLAGEQMDRVIDLSGVAGRPAIQDRYTTYWMQSIDLGLNIAF